MWMDPDVDGSGLTRGTRWCQNYSSSLGSREVIHKKHFPKKRTFLFDDLSYLQYKAYRQSEGTDR